MTQGADQACEADDGKLHGDDVAANGANVQAVLQAWWDFVLVWGKSRFVHRVLGGKRDVLGEIIIGESKTSKH